MGLDMYLEKRHYVKQWDHIRPEKQYAVTVTRGGKPCPHIQPERISYVVEQVAYWRKANAIHRWFVEHCQDGVDDCRPAYVSREQLEQLLQLAQRALKTKVPAEVLPTESGFFFGSTDYDENYVDDMKSTVEQLSAILEEPDDGAEFSYSASW